jgi:hypothetical protein
MYVSSRLGGVPGPAPPLEHPLARSPPSPGQLLAASQSPHTSLTGISYSYPPGSLPAALAGDSAGAWVVPEGAAGGGGGSGAAALLSPRAAATSPRLPPDAAAAPAAALPPAGWQLGSVALSGFAVAAWRSAATDLLAALAMADLPAFLAALQDRMRPGGWAGVGTPG